MCILDIKIPDEKYQVMVITVLPSLSDVRVYFLKEGRLVAACKEIALVRK